MIDRNPQSSVQQTSQSAAQQASRLAAQQPFAVRTTSQEQTIAFGELCAAHFEADDVVVLTGDLGAGKTHFTKGVACALGIADQITSPTFAVMCVYQGDELDLFHLDVYRLEDPSALDDIDVASAFEGGGVSIVEWGDKFLDEMPDDIVICSFARERAGVGSSADTEPGALAADGAHATDSSSFSAEAFCAPHASGSPIDPARIISCTPTGPRSAELVAAWRTSVEGLVPEERGFEILECSQGQARAQEQVQGSAQAQNAHSAEAQPQTQAHPQTSPDPRH